MLRIIKRILKSLAVLAGIFILFLTAFYGIIRIPEVQTFIVNRITSSLLTDIGSNISVGRIEFSFFNRLKINDLLIKDHNQDTLVYAGNMTAGIRRLDLRDKIIRLGKTELQDPVVALITDSTGLMNINWYIDLIKASGGGGGGNNESNLDLSINQITLTDGRFSLINRRKENSTPILDFNNLNLININGTLNDFGISRDTIIFKIEDISFSENKGLRVKGIESSAIISGQYINFSQLLIECDSSTINADYISLLADTTGSFANFSEEVGLNILLRESNINTTDLHYFLPFISDSAGSMELSGRVTGKISELRGRDIKLTYGKSSLLDCDFDFSGLPQIEDAFIFIGVNSLVTNAEDLRFISRISKGKIKLPDFIDKLGQISFDGNFTGFTTDFVTYGKIGTSVGNIRTDLSLRPEGRNEFRFSGLITGTNIDLGVISGNTDLLGKSSMSANVDGFSSSPEEFAGNLVGKIDSIEINRYMYRNVTLNGSFTEKMWDGSINVTDSNIRMDLLGMFSFEKELPEFDFTLNLAEADLFRLNIDKNDSTSAATALITANFKGNNIDNLDGEIKLLNSTLRKYNTQLEIYDFSIRAYNENSTPAINLRTDFLNADIRGHYSFADIGYYLKHTLSVLMPSLLPPAVDDKYLSNNNFTFTIDFRNSDRINNFFRTGILIADKSWIRGSLISDTVMNLEGNSRMLEIKNNIFRNFVFTAGISDNKLSANLTSSSVQLPFQSELKDLSLKFTTKPDTFNFTVNWDNRETVLNKGTFSARGSVKRAGEQQKRPIININIEPSEIWSVDNLWKINRSDILIDSNAIKVNKLYINNNENFYLVDGALTDELSDTLKLEFTGLKLNPLNNLGKKSSPGTDLPLNIGGILDGKVQLTNMYRNPMVEGRIGIENFTLLGSEYGNISIASAWNNVNRVVDIEARNNLKGSQMFNIAGIYDPETGDIDIVVDADRLPVDALNPLLSSFASGISGFASGRLRLSGELTKPVLTGSVMAHNAFMRIDYLQTRYNLNDSIRFDRSGIKFNNLRLTDERGNPATLTGKITHQYFNDFGVDLLINMKDNQVLNTRAKDNELFYGTAYASGVTTIKSDPEQISIDVSARTESNTRFYISLNTSMSVSEYPFISFMEPDTTLSEESDIKKKPSTPPSATGLNLNLDLEATPDAELQIILDLKAGDVMRAHGSGNLNISLNPAGDMRIVGDYIIEDGDYLFTLGNILNKSFTVENGGRITFNGGIEDADIDIKAIYKLKARLFEILNDERFTERIPVECHLNLSGKLFNPVVGFDIFLPMADEETRTYLRNVITTDEELSRQFLYLLVMNSFYADPLGTSGGTTTTGTAAMAVTTTEMLFNQVSNWLSQISNDFDIGFSYRPGDRDINPQELEVALSTQLLNDRVVINSNFDVRGTENSASNTNPITGDFDLEYRLTEKLRFRVFNRFNNPYTGKGVPYTQGIGFFFRKDFNRFADIFKRREKSDMRREEETSEPEL